MLLAEKKKSNFVTEINSVVTVDEVYNCCGFDLATEAVESSMEVLCIVDCYRG